jgi:6,7-dimethyl-8-ribityllumazine synthase
MISQLPAVPEFYKAYVQLSEGLSLMGALHKSLENLSEKLEEKLMAIGDEVYAPGKWRVPVILQHIIDTERIMAYRALRFARKDETGLAGFDENLYADQTLTTTRSVDVLLEELKLVRISNIYMFDNFSDDELLREGTANNVALSVTALGYIIAGHQAHHLHVIQERYQPLAKGFISPF